MKILHCCLANFYIDNYGYQENILPKMHKMQGNEVAILASTETYIGNTNLGYVKPSKYQTSDGISVTRLPYINWLPHYFAKKLRIYSGISKEINAFNPDIIFLHDCQFISITKIADFAKKKENVKIYVDCHTDFVNSARSWVSKHLLHKIIYKWCAQRIEPYVKKFYGTLPIRMEFLKNIYNIPAGKIELLPFGADLSVINLSAKDITRSNVRKSLVINDNDFLIISGGKIDARKNINVLMKAVNELGNENIKLVIFGTADQQMKDEIQTLSESPLIRNIGWIPADEIYKYFLASDLAFFPGTHSVLWEQAVGIGLPCVFKKWDGMQHIDLHGNCLLMNKTDVEEIKRTIMSIYSDNELYKKMKSVAQNIGISTFSYYEIAKKAIEVTLKKI
jgi:glycosyltransferase involved in cell wall biosynthesis